MILDWTAGAIDQARDVYGVPTDAWTWSTGTSAVEAPVIFLSRIAAIARSRRRRGRCAWLLPLLLPGLAMRRAA